MATIDYSPILNWKSPGRCFLNASAADIAVEPPILDIAGGWSFSYHEYLETTRENTIILKLPRETSATIAADADPRFPLKDNTFNTGLCFTALEHLYDNEVTLGEMLES